MPQKRYANAIYSQPKCLHFNSAESTVCGEILKNDEEWLTGIL